MIQYYWFINRNKYYYTVRQKIKNYSHLDNAIWNLRDPCTKKNLSVKFHYEQYLMNYFKPILCAKIKQTPVKRWVIWTFVTLLIILKSITKIISGKIQRLISFSTSIVTRENPVEFFVGSSAFPLYRQCRNCLLQVRVGRNEWSCIYLYVIIYVCWIMKL